MKKLYITLISLILLLSLTACQGLNLTNDTDKNNNDTPDTNDVINDDAWKDNYIYDPDAKLKFETVFSAMPERADIYDIGVDTRFSEVEYIDDNAKKSMDIELFGKEYHFEYQGSKIREISNSKVNIYVGPTVDYYELTIFVDAETNKIVTYYDIPHSFNFTDEAQYKACIQEIAGEDMDLSQYAYNCNSRYSKSDNSSTSVGEEPGFHVIGENETLEYYEMIYRKQIKGVNTASQVLVYFRPDRITVNIYDYEYPEGIFDPIINRKEELDTNVLEYVRSHVKDQYVVDSLNITNTFLFIKDGKTYVMSNFFITFHYPDNPYAPSDHKYMAYGSTVSELVPDNS